MSYDLAVWEGDRPASDEVAYTTFQALYEKYVQAEEPVQPSPRLTAYVEALLARWPDLTEEAGEESPWSTGPHIREAIGPFMYFPMGGAEPRKPGPSPLTLPRRMALCATTRKWNDSGPNSSAADTDGRAVGALPAGRGGRDGGNVDLRGRCPRGAPEGP